MDDNAVDEAMKELDSKDAKERMRGAKRLAKLAPNKRRSEVVKKLVSLSDVDVGAPDPAYIGALGIWATVEDLPILLDLFKSPNGWLRGPVAKIIAPFRDERAIKPFVKWFEGGGGDARDALKTMGPMVEKDLLPLLDHKNQGLKAETIDILKDVGTEASIPKLQEFVDRNDPFHKPWAEMAIKAIRSRGK